MKYDLRKPCSNCPFRSDIKGYLHPDRPYELVVGDFPCHKTLEQSDEGDETVITKDSQHCAGSLIFHEQRNDPHQMMRIAERLGLYDRTKLDMDSVPVFADVEDMVQAQLDNQ